MSYQSDKEAFAAEMKQRKLLVVNIVKITAAILALALVLMTVLLVVDVLNDNGVFSPPVSQNDGPSLIQPTEGKTVKVKQNGTVSYKNLVTYPEGYELDWNSEDVDLTTPGKYTVVYTLMQNGKTVETYKLTIMVEEVNVELEELMTLVAKKAAELGITSDMTKTEQVRKIYDFVNSPTKNKNDANIYFNNQSNTGSDRSDWNTDKWIKEATLTLQNMKGDCYSYYAVSKAFFEYFDIENVGVQRSAASSESGTHFWSVVNVGTEKAPQWYYYDSTRLAGSFADGTKNACLITQEKLDSYLTTAGSTQFYLMDPNGKYPTVSTTPLS